MSKLEEMHKALTYLEELLESTHGSKRGGQLEW